MLEFRIKSALPFFLALLLFPFVSSAQQQQFQEWQFAVPANWQLVGQTSSAVLAPQNVSPNSVYIKLFPSQPITVDLSTWLEAQVTQDISGLTILKSNPVGPVHYGQFSAIQKTIGVQSSSGVKAVRLYIAQSPTADHVELLLFHAELSVAQKYTPVLNEFVSSIHFSGTAPASNAPASSSRPAPLPETNSSATSHTDAAHLDGWYVGSRQRFVPGPNFTFTYKLVWDYYRFYPDGWVYTSFPQQATMDSIRCPQSGVGNEQCQHYSISAGRIQIGPDKPSSFVTVDANEVRIGGNPTWRLRPLQKNPVGTYEAVSGSGMLGTASLSVNQITFLPNGMFTSSGSTGVSSTTANTSANSYRHGSGSGHFKINGYALELDFASGAVVKDRIVAPTDNDPNFLVIGNRNYLKKERTK